MPIRRGRRGIERLANSQTGPCGQCFFSVKLALQGNSRLLEGATRVNSPRACRDP